jgi:hypothetical protein
LYKERNSQNVYVDSILALGNGNQTIYILSRGGIWKKNAENILNVGKDTDL